LDLLSVFICGQKIGEFSLAVDSQVIAGAGEQKTRRALPVETGVAIVLLVLVVWLSLVFPDKFRTGQNASVILGQIAEVGIIAAAMTLVIATGGIDISVGSVVGLCGIVLGKLAVEKGWSLPAAFAASLLVGGACGWLNGTLIARFKLPPIIATLATFSAARAGAYVLSKGDSISFYVDKRPELSNVMSSLGYDNWLGIPRTAWVAIATLVVIGIVLKKTTFGRSVLAYGGNRQAAELSGIKVRRIEIWVYVVSGLLAGLAAIVVAARASTATADAGKLFELKAITAVVLGGTPVTGGRATALGTALGMLVIGVVNNGVRNYGKDDLWGQLVLGIALLAAVEVDRIRNRKKA
jgi:ribose/xylose/arabinose/galactoside ABC-type transport system permease subunit